MRLDMSKTGRILRWWMTAAWNKFLVKKVTERDSQFNHSESSKGKVGGAHDNDRICWSVKARSWALLNQSPRTNSPTRRRHDGPPRKPLKAPNQPTPAQLSPRSSARVRTSRPVAHAPAMRVPAPPPSSIVETPGRRAALLGSRR